MSHSPCFAGPQTRLALAIRRCLGVSLSGALLSLPLTALAQDDAGAEEMDTMVVLGTALKVEAPVLETPRSTSLVTNEALEKRAVTKLDEAFQYRAGVVSPYGSDSNNDWFFLRGFSAEDALYQDGLRLFREGGYFWWMLEPFGLQEVRLLKGPASILYGEAPPGGVINAISKRPTEAPRGLFEVEVGNRDHRQVGIDVSGPINEDVRYRMVGLFSERDGELDGTYNERYYFAPSLEVDLSEDTNITFLASFQKDDGVPTTGFFLPYGSLYDTPYGRVDPSTNLGEPGYDTNERRQLSLGYEFEHYINDTWKFEQNFRYSELDLFLRSVYAFYPGYYEDPQDLDSFVDDGRSATRGIVYRDGQYDAYTVDNRFIGKWYSENFENTFLVGVDYQNFDLNYANGDAFPFGEPIDIFDPAYGNFTPVSENDLVYHDEEKEQIGVYVQNQLRLNNRWVFLAGLRHDSVESTVKSTAPDTTSQGYDEEQLSFSGGIMYLGDYGISPYLSYSESFSPVIGTGPDGEQYVPSEGEQWEIGAKYAPEWLDGYVTAAVFDLKETNTLYSAGEPKQRQGGERHSRGFELEGIGYLSDQLRLTAAYAYTDTTIENPEDGEFRAGLIPRHQASLWLDYSFEDGVLNGLAIGGGARYVGESVDGDKNVPSYTVYDAMASYDFADGWRAQVNVNNLTDEEYISGCNFWCYYGASRSVIGSLSYRW